MMVKWGLVGCGDIARRRVAPALRAAVGCELVAVSRARSELAESFAREFGARRWYADWRELLADGEVGAVYVATPVHLHAAQAVAAAEAGKHVLCEKPMALSAAECDRMIAAARASGVRLGVAYYRRFYPVIARVKEILAAGEIGRPVLAQLNAFERFDPAPGHPRRWLLEPGKSGGGPMFDFGCHRIEVLQNLFGPVARTRGVAANVAFEREVEDTAVAAFEFERGPVGVVSVTHAAREPRDTLDVYGTEGALQVAVLNAGGLKVTTAGGERFESHPPAANVHQPLVEDFARAVREGREPAVTGEAGRAVAAAEDDIYSDARRGRE